MRPASEVPTKIRILHTNDMHGTLDARRKAHLLELRLECDCYFDSGDSIKTGNLGVPLRPEAVWPMLEELQCTASVLGNRESHLVETVLRAKLAGAAHPLLAGNLRRKDGNRPFPGSLVLNLAGVRVGVVAVMVPMVTEGMASKAASAFVWDPPIPAVIQLARALRPSVDLLIALTHIGHRQDLELAEQCPELDAILGGHSHTVVPEPVFVGGTAVCQGGSHNRFAGVYEWESGQRLRGGLRPLA